MEPNGTQAHPPVHPFGGLVASFYKRSDQNGASFLEEEGTALGAPRGVSLCRDITNFAIVVISHTTHRQKKTPENVALQEGPRIRSH